MSRFARTPRRKTSPNFLHYVNNGTYTHFALFHRVVAGFVNQGGGYKLTGPGHTSTSPTVAPVVNEFKLPNIRGTLAMAKLGNDPNSATDQFFFNVANNTDLNTQDGGFTVIGQIMGVQGVAGASQAEGLAVMDAINSDKVYNFGSPLDSIPASGLQTMGSDGQGGQRREHKFHNAGQTGSRGGLCRIFDQDRHL